MAIKIIIQEKEKISGIINKIKCDETINRDVKKCEKFLDFLASKIYFEKQNHLCMQFDLTDATIKEGVGAYIFDKCSGSSIRHWQSSVIGIFNINNEKLFYFSKHLEVGCFMEMSYCYLRGSTERYRYGTTVSHSPRLQFRKIFIVGINPIKLLATPKGRSIHDEKYPAKIITNFGWYE